MNFRAVGAVVSYVFIILALAMGVSAGVGAGMGDAFALLQGTLTAAAITLLAGIGLRMVSWGRHEVTVREAIAITVFTWLALGIAGALPFVLTGGEIRFIDALFESVSGFTTTGATIFRNVESLPYCLLFWRSATQFLGGMGVLVICVAILPLLGAGGMQMFRTEVPGPFKDRLTPRITDTARILWLVYVALTVLLVALLMAAGMNVFDAVCHAFTAMATGGFSTRNVSVLFYQNPAIEWILVVFMFLAACNFNLHYAALRGRSLRVHLRDTEFRFYAGFLLALIGLCAFDLSFVHAVPAAESVRSAAFTVISISTTTGYSTVDFNQWSVFSKGLLLLAMLFGGCVGSTSGGIKQIRALVLFKEFRLRTKAMFNPTAVLKIKVNNTSIPPSVVSAIVSYVAMYLMFTVAAILCMTVIVGDGEVALTSVVSAVGNIGPGFGAVGPLENYAWIPASGKGILIVGMLLGRLEFIAIMAFFFPSFWRR
ncbi:MAG: TrkH family potassium uptake protein [Kiritimatiellae bacterium]|nr:TrkH family potassium uptake protein [Kiritimatiellia bacterium]